MALYAVAAIASIFQAALIAQRMHNPHVLLSVGMIAVTHPKQGLSK